MRLILKKRITVYAKLVYEMLQLGKFSRQAFLMKKRLIISVIILTVFIFSSLLLFRFRTHPLITKLTDTHWGFVTINQVAKITDIPFFYYHFYSNSLPTYNLFIKGNDLDKLFQSIPNPQKTPIVAGFNTRVPAIFVSDLGNQYKVRLKYRGNTATHWAYNKKSFRLRFSDGKSFKNLNTIDLIIPEDRGLVLEHLANFRAKKLNLLAPVSWFANLKINQKSQGLYYLTERIDQDFILNRQLNGTLFGEKDDINNWNANIYQDENLWRTYPEDPHHPDFKYLKQLLELINDPSSTTQEILSLLDLDNFLAWQVHSLIMASHNQNQSHNNRLFYNHEIKKFQFIPWDTGQQQIDAFTLDQPYHPLVDRLLQDEIIKKKRDQLLLDYINNPQNLSEDKDFFQTALDSVYVPLIQDNQKFYPNLKYLLDINSYKDWIDQHFNNLVNQL